MVLGKQVFTYVDSNYGVNQDGERYFSINVITKGTNKRKLSFVTKNPELLDKLSQFKFVDFQDIVLELEFNRLFNSERKTSYWSVDLVGISNINRN